MAKRVSHIGHSTKGASSSSRGGSIWVLHWGQTSTWGAISLSRCIRLAAWIRSTATDWHSAQTKAARLSSCSRYRARESTYTGALSASKRPPVQPLGQRRSRRRISARPEQLGQPGDGRVLAGGDVGGDDDRQHHHLERLHPRGGVAAPD